ncbi:MAG: biopolymer transporter ExbD [Verrucomicrobiota bacterium]
MRLRSNLEVRRGPIDLAPLVDVVLLLLVFFILSSSFVLQPGIQVNPPGSIQEAGVRDSRYIITVTSDLPPLIFFNDKQLDMMQLEKRLRELADDKSDVTVVLRADRDVSHGVVVEIMNHAIKVGLPMLLATQVEKQ